MHTLGLKLTNWHNQIKLTKFGTSLSSQVLFA
jgi:hypothetical protein